MCAPTLKGHITKAAVSRYMGYRPERKNCANSIREAFPMRARRMASGPYHPSLFQTAHGGAAAGLAPAGEAAADASAAPSAARSARPGAMAPSIPRVWPQRNLLN